MTRRDETVTGGPDGVFRTTVWADLEAMRGNDEALKKLVIENLLCRYWKPVYCYLRRKGYDNESAKDLTQAFFHEIVLEKGMLAKAERAKGKFRSFLLASLENYAAGAHQKETAKKRSPSRPVARFSELVDDQCVQIPVTETPDAIFLRTWVSDLLGTVLDEVERDCRDNGQVIHWVMFEGRVLRPILEGGEPAPLDELCRSCGISDKTQATNMIVTVKRRFKRLLEQHLRRQVGSDTAVEGEIDELIEILSTGSAGST